MIVYILLLISAVNISVGADGLGLQSVLPASKGEPSLLDGPTSHEEDADHSPHIFPRRQRSLAPPQPSSPHQLKGDFSDLPVDLLTAESRKKKPHRQSYNHRSKPRNSRYHTQNRHSGGGQNGKGGYHKSDSYQGNSGYSTHQDFNRAHKDSYGDEDHKQFGHKNGNSYGNGASGGRRNGGGGRYATEYGDDGQSYTSAGEY